MPLKICQSSASLYAFVIGVLERPPVLEENEQKWFQAKNEQISHDDISTCSQCRSFSVRQRVCYDNKMPLPCRDYKYGTRFFVSKPKRSKSQQPGACAFKSEVHCTNSHYQP